MKESKMFQSAVVAAAVFCLLAGAAMAQSAPAQPPAQPGEAAPPAATIPLAKQPAVKSQAEGDAVVAMLQAAQGPDPDARITACQNLINKFPNSEFKPLALFFMTMSFQEKNDYEKTIAYGELTLKEDPENIQTLLLLSRLIASRTRENDLDKEEKLKTAEKYATHAVEATKTSPRPNPSVTDEQWIDARKEMLAQAYEAFAMIAMARENTEAAIEQFKKAIETSPGDPATMVRLGNALAKAGKYDEAISTFERVMAIPDAPQQVKQIAQAERVRAVQAKSGK